MNLVCDMNERCGIWGGYYDVMAGRSQLTFDLKKLRFGGNRVESTRWVLAANVWTESERINLRIRQIKTKVNVRYIIRKKTKIGDLLVQNLSKNI